MHTDSSQQNHIVDQISYALGCAHGPQTPNLCPHLARRGKGGYCSTAQTIVAEGERKGATLLHRPHVFNLTFLMDITPGIKSDDHFAIVEPIAFNPLMPIYLTRCMEGTSRLLQPCAFPISGRVNFTKDGFQRLDIRFR